MPRISELKWQRKHKNQDFFKTLAPVPLCPMCHLNYWPASLEFHMLSMCSSDCSWSGIGISTGDRTKGPKSRVTGPGGKHGACNRESAQLVLLAV